ncbi:hypothetical protein CsatA_011044 [Cannabis sativa]
MVRDADKSLFSGCEKRRLSTMVKFYNIKAENGVSDKCFSQFLSAFKEILPMENCFPESTYEVKKTLSSIGLKYEKIHACPNDCILYRKEHAHMDTCPECGLPRYKPNKSKEIRKLIPEKVLWYMPLIPRLKRFYRSAETAENLLWHEKRRVKDGKLRHPADSQAWKKVNYLNPDFAAEPRHLRCIWENLNQRQKELYKFYDVELLSYNNEQDKVIAINQLSIWLNTMTHVGQYYFIPWNIGKHWMLIIAMTSGRVVFLNPLKSKIPSDIAQMIKAAYANISSNAIVFGKNGPEIWTFACPKQPYNYECGYYVLTYIRDMLQHSNPIEAIKAKSLAAYPNILRTIISYRFDNSG